MAKLRLTYGAACLGALVLVGGLTGLSACTPAENAPEAHGVAVADHPLASPQGVPSKLTRVLKNVSDIPVQPANLRFLFQAFLAHDEAASYGPRVLVGLNASTDYFYVWLQKAQWDEYVLYCHGNLRNQAGASVPVDSLGFGLAADLDANGSSEIVGLQSNTSWMYAWDLAQCNDGVPGQTGTSARYTTLVPNWNGKQWNGDLYDSNDHGNTANPPGAVPVNQLTHVVSGHWLGTGLVSARQDQIRALRADGHHYVWSLHPSGAVDLWKWNLRSMGLLADVSNTPVPGNHIRYAFENRKDVNNNNTGSYKHELIAIADDGVNARALVWEDPSTAVRQFPLCKNSASSCANAGKTLVFSLDQGFVNGLVANADQPGFDAAFDRVVAVLERFQDAGYHVVALLNPGIRQDLKGRLVKVLDRLRADSIPFMFDIYSSDTNSMCTRQPRFSQCPATFSGSQPGQGYVAMRRHPTGATTDANYVDFYVARYGSLFEGLRIFEVLSLHWGQWTEGHCSGTWPAAWAYDSAMADELIAFAEARGQYVFFTDNKWHNPYERYWLPCSTWAPINEVRDDVETFAASHPGVIVLGYSNNEGVRDHSDGYYPHNYRLRNWQTRLTGIAHLKGLGLSNQTWSTDGHRMLFDETLPPEELAIWAADAFHKGATLVQLEPFHYLFQWDRGQNADWEAAMDLTATPWSEAGKPTPELRRFAELMGVVLPN